MRERPAVIEDGRWMERRRRAAEMQLMWAAEAAARSVEEVAR